MIYLNKRLNEALNTSDNTTVSTEFYDVIKKYSDLNIYEGKEKYSFISYAHRDAEIVLNIVNVDRIIIIIRTNFLICLFYQYKFYFSNFFTLLFSSYISACVNLAII